MAKGMDLGSGTGKERIAYLDYMRVISAFAIVALHCSAQNWGSVPVNGFQWQIFNVYDSAVRWGVPVFVMISGALLLSRKTDMEELYKKHVFRMARIYFLWSFLYALADGGGIVMIAQNTIKGHYHMWFIPMIIGLYICVPIIKPLLKKKLFVRYFMMLAVLFGFVIPDMLMLVMDFGNAGMREMAECVRNLTGNLYLNMPKGYVFYFILGYGLSEIDIERDVRRIIYAFGAAGFVLTVVLSAAVSVKNGMGIQNYYNEFTLNVMAESIAVFVFVKHIHYSDVRLNGFMESASKYCFGAYLSYAFVMDFLNRCFGLNTLSFGTPFSVPVLSFAVFLIAITVSAVLHRTPYLKRYII